MGLIESEISELRGLLDQVRDGKADVQQVSMQLAIYNGVYKREQLMFDIWKESSKRRGILKNVINKNLLASGEAIDCGDGGGIKLACPGKGGLLVDVDACLDFSGDERNIEDCQKCSNFSIVRKMKFAND